MPTFRRVEGEKNLFIDENGNHYTVSGGEMKPVVQTVSDEDDMDFLSDRFRQADVDVANGKIEVCNLDSDECESCGS